MRSNGNTKPKMEFSKKILIVAAIINIAVLLFSCVMVWRTGDLTPLAYMIPTVAAEVATGTAYYYWKAKAENTIKLKNSYGNFALDEMKEGGQE